MRTPKEFKERLKKKEITENMLGLAIYSVNKRAKNYRDKEKAYRYYYFDNSYEKKMEYYSLKERLLKALTPLKIHRQRIEKVIKVYSSDFDKFEDYEKEKKKDFDKIFWENSFFRYKDEYSYVTGEGEEEEVFFYKKYEEDFLFFLYFEIGDFSFHQPISKEDLKDYSLKVENIRGDFFTLGEDFTDLISMNFVREVLKLIEEGDYKIVK